MCAYGHGIDLLFHTMSIYEYYRDKIVDCNYRLACERLEMTDLEKESYWERVTNNIIICKFKNLIAKKRQSDKDMTK